LGCEGWQPLGTVLSGGTTPGHARSNDLAVRSTALALPYLLLCFASVKQKIKILPYLTADRFISLFVLF